MAVRDEFQLRKLGLQYNKPCYFFQPQFVSARLYIVLRVLWTVFNISWIMASGLLNYNFASTEANRVKWFTFLTNWTFLLLTIHSILHSILVIYHHITNKPLENGEDIAWYIKVFWVLSNIVYPGSFLVTCLFWIVIFPGITTLYAVTFVVHTLNSVYVLFDLFMSRLCIRLLHSYQVMVYGVVYLLFTAVYQLSGGRGRRNEPSIYPVLNWNNPKKTSVLCVIGVFVVAPLMHLVVFLLTKCRVAVYNKLCRHTEKDKDDLMAKKKSQTDLELNEVK